MVDVFVDANIFLDAMRSRSGWHDSAKVIDRVNIGQTSGFISSLTLSTLFYELRKSLTSKEAVEELQESLEGFRIADLDKEVLETILSDGRVTDFEDRVQYYSAKKSCNVIVTRNKRDFRRVSKEIEVLTPEEFLTKYP